MKDTQIQSIDSFFKQTNIRITKELININYRVLYIQNNDGKFSNKKIIRRL